MREGIGIGRWVCSGDVAVIGGVRFQGNRRVKEFSMNKGDLIDAVSGEAGLSKADASRAVESVISAITRALKDGNQVSLVGFGTFTVKTRAARTGRNPRTGDAIEIRASRIPGFRAGKALKDAVN
ncbi:DNA-binding protein HU-beta [Gammaproteobacteria bacterium]|nr:DNA-binding protein HU-beta [Gammaproteobacteria bacterium]